MLARSSTELTDALDPATTMEGLDLDRDHADRAVGFEVGGAHAARVGDPAAANSVA